MNPSGFYVDPYKAGGGFLKGGVKNHRMGHF